MKAKSLFLVISSLVLLSCGGNSPTTPPPPTTNNYTLTVATSPSGAGNVTKDPNKTSFAAGTAVTVTATATTGYVFSSWTGDLTGTANPGTITMNGNKTVIAVFTTPTQYTLTVVASPSNGGSVTKSPNQSSYASGTVVTLTATPASGYSFTRWEGDLTGTTSPATITMNGNKTVTAVFTGPTQYTLTVAASPSNGGSVTKSPNQTQYASGTSVTLTATPASGYTFTRWEGDVTGTANPTTITMNANKSVTAVFTATTYLLRVFASPSRGGTVTKSPDGTEYAPGTVVTLTAIPASGYQFTRWEDSVTGTANPTTVTMNASKSVTAVFTVPPSWQAPGISAPQTGTIGVAYSVTMTYSSWPQTASSLDRLELEESISPSSGFQLISNSTWGQHPSSYTTSINKTQQGTYYYRARAYISYGGTSGYSPYSPTVSVAVQGGASMTQFINNSSYPIISLKLDNVEQFSYPNGISPGYYYEMAVSPGLHNCRLANGFYDGTTKFEMYYISGTYTQPAGSTYSVTFSDPSINQLLTSFDVSRLWSGEFYDNNQGYHKAAFRFYSNGTWVSYVDGAQRSINGSAPSSGSYWLVRRTPSAFTVTFSVGSFEADLQELHGYFYMRNGPSNWQLIQYTNQGTQAPPMKIRSLDPSGIR